MTWDIKETKIEDYVREKGWNTFIKEVYNTPRVNKDNEYFIEVFRRRIEYKEIFFLTAPLFRFEGLETLVRILMTHSRMKKDFWKSHYTIASS
jgi:hypothetical protein